ncbi:AAA family ATPase [Haloimpatiens lingqiaonensis]|uniref:AAA family ATPase n=1 Tax=Haloimpatiens lingqiaonensis TaxID=1380675 RepID=UPI0010FDA8D1|nr:MoxR family ATPase [Haloimpatiens lingqiaonensis]
MNVEIFKDFRKKVNDNVSKVIVGKEEKIDKIIVAFICGGHVLLEDVPGVGKTKLVKAMSKSMNCSFKRIQFTPDLLPSDLTGIYYYNAKEQEFQFKPGPILSQFVLGDEINRATPRTQSALLESMEERQVTVEGNTIKLNRPFFVMATQNPIEQFGTFPLPEAQLDRFFIRLSMGYPEYMDEKKMMDRFIEKDPIEELESVVTMEEINYVQDNYSKVYVSDEMREYILNVIIATRKHNKVEVGCSPRATLALMKGSQAHAAVKGRDYMIPEDVKAMAVPIITHRLVLKSENSVMDNKGEYIVEEILNTVKTPLEEV